MKTRARTADRAAEIDGELFVPQLPTSLTYLWNIFTRLSARRGNNGFGPSLVTYADLMAFQMVTGFALSAWEVEMIEMLDGIYLSVVAESRRDHKKAK